MPENPGIQPDAAPHTDQVASAPAKSASNIDPSLVALIRQALDASRLTLPLNGPGREAAGQNAVVNHIGKFEVLGEIGRGGFGTVLLVRDPDLGRQRALKVP